MLIIIFLCYFFTFKDVSYLNLFSPTSLLKDTHLTQQDHRTRELILVYCLHYQARLYSNLLDHAAHRSAQDKIHFPGVRSLCARMQWPQRNTTVYFLSFVLMERRTKNQLPWNRVTTHSSQQQLGRRHNSATLQKVTSVWSFPSSPKATAEGTSCIKTKPNKEPSSPPAAKQPNLNSKKKMFSFQKLTFSHSPQQFKMH